MKRLIYIFLFLVASTIHADENIKFRHLSMTDGLSDNQINHITRDSQGFMWFSTSHGINRYDGYTFKVFDKTEYRDDNYIVNVQEDATGLLWVRNKSGNYLCLDPYKETYLNAEDVLAKRYGIIDKVSLIYVDRNKDLWIHDSTKGTLHYDFNENKITSKHVAPSAPDIHGSVTGISEDRQGIVRIYTDGFLTI